MKSIHHILTLIFASILLGFNAPEAYGIGDSGGCTRPARLINAAAFGTPSELSEIINAMINSQSDSNEMKGRNSPKDNSTAIGRSLVDTKKQFLNSAVPCSGTEVLLDHAVINGNLPVVKWLLDNGANPNGTTDETYEVRTIFSRCGASSRQSNRPDGLPPEEATRRMIAAFKVVMSRGADLNRVWGNGQNPATLVYGDPRNALTDCLNDEMIEPLLSLGADRSPAGFGQRRKLVPLQKATWLAAINKGSTNRIKDLSRGGFNDLRGTLVEGELNSHCAKPENQARCTEISTLVKLNPGAIPTKNYRTGLDNIIQDEFSAYREGCFFPELQFYSDYDFAVVGAKNTGSGSSGQIDVKVNSPKKPTLLFLQAQTPTTWNIQRISSSKIIGVVAAKSYNDASQKDKILGLESHTPIFAGPGCPRWIEYKFPTPRLIGPKVLDPTSINPFFRKDPSKVTITESNLVVIGDSDLSPSPSTRSQ